MPSGIGRNPVTRADIPTTFLGLFKYTIGRSLLICSRACAYSARRPATSCTARAWSSHASTCGFAYLPSFCPPVLCKKLNKLPSGSTRPDHPFKNASNSPRLAAANAEANSDAVIFTSNPASAAIAWIISPICRWSGLFGTVSAIGTGSAAPASFSNAFARATSRSRGCTASS